MTLAMHPTLKRFLLIFSKNAVYAVLTNSALMLQWHDTFNFNNWAGVWAITRATLSVIGAREALIWGPMVLKWSQTNADADSLEVQALKKAAEANVVVQQKAAEVQDAVTQAKDAAAVKDSQAQIKKEDTHGIT